MAPGNRKERRAAAAEADNTKHADDLTPVPMARPSEVLRPRDPDAKTLYQLAAERQPGGSDLPASVPAPEGRPSKTEFIHILPSGELSVSDSIDGPNPSSPPASVDVAEEDDADEERDSEEETEEEEERDEDAPVPPLPDTLLFSFPLSALHCTLSFLAAHQFAQEIRTWNLIRETIFIAFPALTFVIHLSHGHIISFKGLNLLGNTQGQTVDSNDLSPTSLRALFRLTPQNIIFLSLSILLGAQLIAISNGAGYYAVMKKAPPVGTLWVWCVLEMSPGFAALGLLLPMAWATLWKGYGII